MRTSARRIALVQGGEEKLSHAAQARELYTGPFFRAAMAVAEAEFVHAVWILSDWYELACPFDPAEVLEPYTLTLDEATPADPRERWATGVLHNLTSDDGSPAHLTVYADAVHVDALREHLPPGWMLTDPLAGLDQDQRLAWLRDRLARVASPTPSTTSAGLSGSASESSMPVATTATRLTNQQRQESFTRALELERGLTDLPGLRAELLARLAALESDWRTEHTRRMAEATTGQPSGEPEQQPLPLEGTAEVSPLLRPLADLREGMATFTENLGKVFGAEAPPPPEPPAPKRQRKPAAPRGEKRARAEASSRTAAAPTETAQASAPVDEDLLPAPAVPCCSCGDSVADHEGGHGACTAPGCKASPRCGAFELGQVHGWRLEWGGPATPGGKFFRLVSPARVPTGAIQLVDGRLLNRPDVDSQVVEDVVALARTHGRWPSHDPAGAPLRLLTFVQNFLVEEEQRKQAAQQPAHGKRKRGAVKSDVAPEPERDGRAIIDEENRLLHEGRGLPTPPEFAALEGTALLDAEMGEREESQECRDELKTSGTRHPCQLCDTTERPRARVDFSRHYRPRGVKTWNAEKGRGVGGVMLSRWLCVACCTPERLSQERLARQARARGVESEQEEGDAGSFECDGCTQGFPKEKLHPVEGGTGTAYYCEACYGDVCETTPNPSERAPDAAPPGWRVELAEHPLGRLVPVWLVQAATGERRAALWWGGTGELRCGHHGEDDTLRGKALQEANALQAWWKEHLADVVRPLELVCRAGHVPGLRVGKPEPLSHGPYPYALSNGWRLEAWESDEGAPFCYLRPPADPLEAGPFTLAGGHLVASVPAVIAWAQKHEAVLAEAEAFILRGFVPELRKQGSP